MQGTHHSPQTALALAFKWHSADCGQPTQQIVSELIIQTTFASQKMCLRERSDCTFTVAMISTSVSLISNARHLISASLEIRRRGRG